MQKKYLFAIALIATALALGATRVDASMAVGSTCGSSSNPCPPDYFILDQNGGTWGVTGSPGNWVLLPQGSIAGSNSIVYLNSPTLPRVLQVKSVCAGRGTPVCTTTLNSSGEQAVVSTTTVNVVQPVIVVTPTVVVPSVTPTPVSTSGAVETNVITNQVTAPKVSVDSNESAFTLVATTSVNQAPIQATAASPTASVCSYLTLRMGLGSRGEGVYALQNFLKDTGYFNVDATGYFGQVTFKAVQSFQTSSGLDAVGSVGPLTRGRIGRVACGK